MCHLILSLLSLFVAFDVFSCLFSFEFSHRLDSNGMFFLWYLRSTGLWGELCLYCDPSTSERHYIWIFNPIHCKNVILFIRQRLASLNCSSIRKLKSCDKKTIQCVICLHQVKQPFGPKTKKKKKGSKHSTRHTNYNVTSWLSATNY